MKKDHWILLLLCLGVFLNSAGQNNVAQEVNDLTEAQVIEKDYKFNNNISSIEQVGNDNTANVTQNGYENINHIKQTGSEIDIRIQQLNSSNEAILQTLGENIKVYATQTGNANQINTYIQNNGFQIRSAELMQEGNFNKIELSLTGNGFADPTPEQRVVINQVGNSHELKAVMEPFSAPLEINQTAGPGGEGMKIDVSTSALPLP